MKGVSSPTTAAGARAQSDTGEYAHESIIQGLRTHWLQAGQGEVLLFLHGWGSDSSVMWPLASSFLDAGFRILALDLPGFGQTEAPPEPWSAGDYAQFVRDFIKSHNIAQLNVVGHSFGGSVAMLLAAEQPERVGKLVLLNSAGVRRAPAWPARWRAQAIRSARSALQLLGLSGAAARLSDWSAVRFGSEDYRAARGVMRRTLVRVLAEDLTATSGRIQAATLLLWGEQDEATPLWQGKLLESTIPDAGLHVFPGAGHYAFLERLTETGHILRYFFQETG